MVVIDEKSLEVEGRWPWPRSKFATLVDILSREGAKVIGFDVIFSEPDENSQLSLIDEFAGTLDALAINDPRLRRFVTERRRHADNDVAFAEAIKRSRAAVVLGYFFHDQSTLEYQLDAAETERRLQTIAGSKYPRIRRTAEDRVGATTHQGTRAPDKPPDVSATWRPPPAISVSRATADGVLRWMPLVIQGGRRLFPPLGLLCAWHYLGRPAVDGRGGHPRGRGRPDRRAIRAHRRGRPTAHRLSRRPEDVPLRLRHRRPRPAGCRGHLQEPDRARGGDGRRHLRSAQHAVRPALPWH